MTRVQSRLPLKVIGTLLLRIWFCVSVLLTGMPVRAHDNQPIVVSGTSNISFGMLFRNSTSSIAPSSGNAARFVVAGREQEWVVMAVSINTLNAASGSSVDLIRRMLTPTLVAANCQYSRDGGMTWKPFSSTYGSYAWVITQFPNGPGTTGTIQIRVGASVTSSGLQQRGNYSGSVRLIATYLSGDDNNGHGNDSDHNDDDNPGSGWQDSWFRGG
jgi:hypothetical protein